MEFSGAKDCKELQFIHIPKVELHAHLNGSLNQNTLQKLILMKKEKGDDEAANLSIPKLPSNGISHCFETFNLIHRITNTPEAIYMATCDVIADFCNDGVSYLELRTTPKDVGPSMTQDMYVETVLKAINDSCFVQNKDIDVRLLLSLDRKRPVCDAEKTLKLAEKFFISSDRVVGLDFSGDPSMGDVLSFLPILESAKKKGMKLAVHIAEIPHGLEEVKHLLNLEPDRLGHGTNLHPLKSGSTRNFEICKRLRIPLEICLTSNVISKTVPSYEDHHYKLFREINYPCILCTDDKGIFNTTLSNEYYLAYKYYSISKEELFNISFESIDYIFSSNHVKKELKEKWVWKKNLLKFLSDN